MLKLNYFYFGLFLFFLLLLHLFHLIILDDALLSSKFLLLLPILGQCFLEALILAIAASALEKKGYTKIANLIVTTTFFILVVHFIDFALIRIMNFSFWYAIESYVFLESLDNFIELIYASNIPVLSWLLASLLVIFLSLCSFLVYRLCGKLSEKKPLYLTYKTSLISSAIGVAFIVSVSMFSRQHIENSEHEMLEKILPWKTTFSTSKKPIFTLQKSLKDPYDRLLSLQEEYENSSFISKGKPNIYLFVIESLRKDYVTASITPNINRFKNEHLDFQDSFSNANATQISWFTLFHSISPFYWRKINLSNWEKGSVPLQVLKKMGYHIHVHSSSRLNYYQMDEVIFGKGKYLVDEFHFFNHDDSMPAWKSDELTMDSLCKDVQDPAFQNGTVHIIFLDSSHFPYSWNDESSPFTPYDKQINYLEATCFKKGLEEIKNRYKNSMHYIDTLFGKFYSLLEKQPQWKKSIVVVTGDHGEEFFESGNLFHATDLTNPQTSVPILCKFGTEKLKNLPLSVSHIDIFPSILHYLTRQTLNFGGQSIFLKERSPFVLSVRYNAGRTPYEFFILNGKNKMTARFSNQRDIFTCHELEILSLHDEQDKKIDHDRLIVEGMLPALEKLLGN